MQGNYISIQRQPLGSLNHESELFYCCHDHLYKVFIKHLIHLVQLYFKSMMKGYSPRQKLTTDCGPVMLLSWRVFFKIVMFLLKNMLIYDKPLLIDQPPLSSHLLILRGWPLNGGSTLQRNKKRSRLYRLRNNSQHLLARNTGSRWIVLTVICKRMQQLQARMKLRVNHGTDTTNKRL